MGTRWQEGGGKNLGIGPQSMRSGPTRDKNVDRMKSLDLLYPYTQSLRELEGSQDASALRLASFHCFSGCPLSVNEIIIVPTTTDFDFDFF